MPKQLEGEVVELDIIQVVPYRRNAKKGNNVEMVKQSIQEFGYNSYIVVDKDNCIIAGHSRYKALVELGYKKNQGYQDRPHRKQSQEVQTTR